ncbi:MAG: cytochrome P450 [Woeseiaceae bacterium]|nr:cytochrome P450 [Woeseiaceae bacterium]
MADWDASDPFAAARREQGALEGDFLGERIPLILRYKDVRAAAGDYETYSSDAPFRVPIPSEENVRNVRQLPIETDPPDHADYRAIVQPFFSAPKRPEMITKVEALVGDMLAEVVGAEPVEIMEDFALPLQSRALTLLLNMPMSEADEWISWGQHVFHGEDGHSAEKGSVLDRYLHRQFDRAEQEPGDDFFSALVNADFRGRRLTRDELIGFANLAFAGGRDTVIATVSLALAHLAAHPDDVERLRQRPMLVRSATEEIVRIASPLTMIGRTCPANSDVSGLRVKAGDRVAICWASANRDETVFEAPEELRIDRKRNPHVAFGAGPHMCLGASHARLVLRSLISRVCTQTGGLELLDSEAKYEEWPAYRRQTGFHSLRIRFLGKAE